MALRRDIPKVPEVGFCPMLVREGSQSGCVLSQQSNQQKLVAGGGKGRSYGLRDRVDDMWSLSLAGIPILQDIKEATHTLSAHTLCVHGHGNNVQSARPCSLDGVHVAAFLDQHALPALGLIISQSLEGLGEAISGAGCQDDFGPVLVGHVGMHLLPGELAEEAVQGRIALSSAIL